MRKTTHPNQQAELRNKIVTRLAPWVCDDELNYLKTGARYIAPDKLPQMDQFLQDKETTNTQKAILAKAMLTKGHMDSMKSKINKGMVLLSLPLLITIGYLSVGVHGMIKGNMKEQLSAIFMGTAAYFMADKLKQKFLDSTKDSRSFFRILGRDEQEQKRIEDEHLKWFAQSSRQM